MADGSLALVAAAPSARARPERAGPSGRGRAHRRPGRRPARRRGTSTWPAARTRASCGRCRPANAGSCWRRGSRNGHEQVRSERVRSEEKTASPTRLLSYSLLLAPHLTQGRWHEASGRPRLPAGDAAPVAVYAVPAAAAGGLRGRRLLARRRPPGGAAQRGRQLGALRPHGRRPAVLLAAAAGAGTAAGRLELVAPRRPARRPRRRPHRHVARKRRLRAGPVGRQPGARPAHATSRRAIGDFRRSRPPACGRW